MAACTNAPKNAAQNTTAGTDSTAGIFLPEPDEDASHVKVSRLVPWPKGKLPTVPAGFTVKRFAGNLANPRWIYAAPNGDIFVSQAKTSGKSANNILRFTDTDGDGVPDSKDIYLQGLNKPFGMAIIGKYFYVANTDALWRYPYTAGAAQITAEGEKILDLPAGGYNNHWTRNIITSPDEKYLYITVGSGSNVAEHGMANEVRRACILRITPDGKNEIVYADGLRNPVGLAWRHSRNELWTAVNERDGLGDELVPDYITSVRQGAFYGWPYSYIGQHIDPRRKGERPDMVDKATTPDILLGSHTASLGLCILQGDQWPQRYKKGAFVGQHGSWNRSKFAGYRVAWVPFNATHSGEDFLSGFIANEERSEVYGRPVGVAELNNGAMLVADDAGNCVWWIQYTGK